MFAEYLYLMQEFGLDPSYTGTTGDDPASIGNRIGHAYIGFGLLDERENSDYGNRQYESVNRPLFVAEVSGNDTLDFPNRWQPLGFEDFIDQSGNTIEGEFRPSSAWWGFVTPFSTAVTPATYQQFEHGRLPRSGSPRRSLKVRGLPRGFERVLMVLASIPPTTCCGTSPEHGGKCHTPHDARGRRRVLRLLRRGRSPGRVLENPVTGEPYPEQWVPRGDYARVLAEFWADGPDSETPPGHWFTILNDVMDHPLFERRIGGIGPELDPSTTSRPTSRWAAACTTLRSRPGREGLVRLHPSGLGDSLDGGERAAEQSEAAELPPSRASIASGPDRDGDRGDHRTGWHSRASRRRGW